MVKTSPGGLPYEIVLYFADEGTKPLVSPLDGISKLEPPGISIIGIPVTRTTWSLRLPSGYKYISPGGNMSQVVAIVERLILDNEAKLEQLKRLDQSYRELAIKGNTSQIQSAKTNYDTFNKKLATDIQETEKYLYSNSGQISKDEYDRLKSSLEFQQQRQNIFIEGNSEFNEKQRQQLSNNMNDFLNGSVSNYGVAENTRNIVLNQMPEFVGKNEQQQIERLNKELEESNQIIAKNKSGYVSDTKTRQQGKTANDLIIDSDDQDNLVAETLKELGSKVDSSIEQRQQQLQEQINQMGNNRFQRYNDSQRAYVDSANKPVAQQQPMFDAPQSGGGAMMGGGMMGGGFGGGADRGGGRGGQRSTGAAGPGSESPAEQEYASRLQTWDRAETATGTQRRDQALGNGPIIENGQTTTGGFITWEEAAAKPYASQNVYSLPVSLPAAGEIQLDFARSSGQAELSVWAVPVRTITNLVATLVISGLALLIFAIIKLWPKYNTKRSLSKRVVLFYILLVIVICLLFGVWGLIASLFIVLLNEARHAIFA